MTVAENLALSVGKTDGRTGIAEAINQTAERYGLGVDPDKRIFELSMGERQRVEIIKLLMLDAEVLIFDEPTSVLTPPEVDSLFAVIDRLRAEGKTIVLITHKLEEVLKLADDISIMRGLGNILILAPSDAVEAKQIIRFALDYDGPVYIRMDSDKFPVLHGDDYQFEPGKVDVLQEGDDVTIVAVGSTVYEAAAAAQELQAASIGAEVLNISSVRPLEKARIIESLRKTGKVMTVEEHSLHGGIGSLVAEIIAEEQLDVQFKRLGITEGQFSKAGPRKEIRAYYHIDAPGIVQTAKQLLGK
jgi:energy-coupling factor transporter ATP-binding protein EcfA2